MFTNIGKKIKVLSVIFCVILVIAAIVTGIIFLIDSYDSYDDFEVAIGLIIIIAGPIVAWISSFFMYGFGEIICLLQQSVDPQTAPAKKEKESEKIQFIKSKK